MPDPTPALGAAIDYAAVPARTVADRQLHRLVVWNVVCAPLMFVQLPGCFAGTYFGMQALRLVPARPTTWANFEVILGPHPERLVPTLLWYAGSGIIAAVSAACISRRRWRWFGIVSAFLMCFTMPFGTVAGLMTGIVLVRRASADAYAAHRGRPEPR